MVGACLSVCALSACSPHHSLGTTTTSTTVAPATTSTLPATLYVQGSAVNGTDGFLGGARRVAVPEVPPGATTAKLPRPGDPGYTDVERLAFRRFGAGPDLLLVMGQDGSMTWWDPAFLSLLAQHYRVTVFDLPGVGYSSPPAATLSLDLMADDTAGLIESLGLARPAVLGWGLGGAVAIAVAERHPGSISSLVVADASAGGPSALAPTVAVQHRLAAVSATPASLASAFFSPSWDQAQLSWLSAFTTEPPDPVIGPVIRAEAVLASALATSRELVSALASIKVPTLVAYGGSDRVVPPANAAIIGEGIPGARRIEYPGADYGAIFEEQSSFVPALEQFTG